MTRRRCHRRPGQAQAGNRVARHIAVPHPRVLPPRSRGSTPMPPPLSLEAWRAGECYSGCRQGLLAGPNPAASQRVPCQRQCGRVRGGWSRTGGITVGEYRGDRIVFGHRQARQLPGGAPRAHASPVEVPEQPRRELSPADPATRAGDETLQVDPARATIPVRVQRHLAALSAPSAPAVGRRLPTGDGASRSGTRSPGRRPRPPPESATGTRRFDQAHGSTSRIITSAN